MEKTSSYYWTEEQKKLLEQAYTSGNGLPTAVELITDKKRTTIAAQASRLGLTKPKPRKNRIDEPEPNSFNFHSDH